MTAPALVSIQHLNELLSDRLEELCEVLLGGRKKGREWIAARQAEGGPGDSLQVALLGYKRGKWMHHAAGVGGDALGLIAYLRCNNDMKRAIDWAREFLGGVIPEDNDEAKRQRQIRMRQAEAKLKRERQAAEGQARFIFFKRSEPLVSASGGRSPAWHYLNERLCGRFEQLGHLPGCLRYVPDLYHPELDKKMPAMVGGIVNLKGDLIGLHRTWLIKRDGVWDRVRGGAEYEGYDKARVEIMGKKVLGSMKGGAIRLWAGTRQNLDTGEIRRGWPWSKLPPRSHITLAEGIETGLSLALMLPARRLAVAVSIEGFVDIELPECFSDVTLAAENDPDNKHAAGAIERAKQRHAAAGRTVRVVYPPAGASDWNDVLKESVGRVA